MDTLEKYRGIVRKVIREYSKIPYSYGDIRSQTVFDTEDAHYLLVIAGREGVRRVHGCLVHIDIIGDKVWIQRDGTEDGIATELLRAGVPKDRIVLGFRLVTPPGWSRSERQPLPTDDHGFTIAYEHESGLAVTLYQYTRGLTYIPNDVNASLLKGEFNRTRNGIEQAVQFGLWQSAKEKIRETVTLGNSQQQALWSQYELAVTGEPWFPILTFGGIQISS